MFSQCNSVIIVRSFNVLVMFCLIQINASIVFVLIITVI